MDESVLKSFLSNSSTNSDKAGTTSHSSTPTIISPPLPSSDSSLPPTSTISIPPAPVSFFAPKKVFSTNSTTSQGGGLTPRSSFGSLNHASSSALPDRVPGKFKIIGQVGAMSNSSGSRMDASALLGGGEGGGSGSSGAELLGYCRPSRSPRLEGGSTSKGEQKLILLDGEMLPPPPALGITRSKSGGYGASRAPLRRDHHEMDVATPDTTIRREILQTVRSGNSVRQSKVSVETTVEGEGETEFKEEEDSEQVSRTEGSGYQGVGEEITGSKRARSDNHEGEYNQFEEGQRRKSRRQEDEVVNFSVFFQLDPPLCS